jgi:hypothetical protein
LLRTLLKKTGAMPATATLDYSHSDLMHILKKMTDTDGDRFFSILEKNLMMHSVSFPDGLQETQVEYNCSIVIQ